MNTVKKPHHDSAYLAEMNLNDNINSLSPINSLISEQSSDKQKNGQVTQIQNDGKDDLIKE